MGDMFPLTLVGVSVRRKGRRLIGPVDLEIGPIGVTVIIGPNGSGKTTLLKLMHGLEGVSDGAVTWGLPDAEVQRRQAYVFQSPVMLRRSVRANLRYPLELLRQNRNTIDHAVDNWLARAGLTAHAGLQATRLSGGEKQKLAIARALIREPDVLFLDEPTSNLDGRATREIEDLLHTARAHGTRIIMTTHDMGQAKRMATEGIFMKSGHVHETGAAESFFLTPKTSALGAFLKGDIIE